MSFELNTRNAIRLIVALAIMFPAGMAVGYGAGRIIASL